MFEVKDLSYSTEEKILFEKVSFSMYSSEKVGLIGPNGSGKSTLLSLISGKRQYDSGFIFKKSNLSVFHLDIKEVDFTQKTVEEVALPVWCRLKYKLEEAMQKLETASQSGALLDSYSRIFEEFERAGGWDVEADLKRNLNEVDLNHVRPETPVSRLSGGERMKVALAGMLFDQFELALLDEPTNNLDNKHRLWLTEFIGERPEAFLIVSHDRDFLDAVVSKTLVLNPLSKEIKQYGGNYSWTKERMKSEQENLKAHHEVQKRLIKRLYEDVEATKEQALKTEKETQNDYIRYRSKKVAAKAKARENRLMKIIEDKKISLPGEYAATKFEVLPGSRRNSLILSARDLGIGYDSETLIDSINIELRHGERVAVLGDNGSGKTSLVRVLTGELKPQSGTIYRNEHLCVGYLSQKRLENKLESRVIDVLMDKAGNDPELQWSESRLRKHLNSIHIRAGSVYQNVGDLSEGERTKLELSAQLLANPDLLVLDEPTNHLDIETKEAIESAISRINCALIIVSHDRNLIERSNPDWLWLIEDRRLTLEAPDNLDALMGN